MVLQRESKTAAKTLLRRSVHGGTCLYRDEDWRRKTVGVKLLNPVWAMLGLKCLYNIQGDKLSRRWHIHGQGLVQKWNLCWRDTTGKQHEITRELPEVKRLRMMAEGASQVAQDLAQDYKQEIRIYLGLTQILTQPTWIYLWRCFIDLSILHYYLETFYGGNALKSLFMISFIFYRYLGFGGVTVQGPLHKCVAHMLVQRRTLDRGKAKCFKVAYTSF